MRHRHLIAVGSVVAITLAGCGGAARNGGQESNASVPTAPTATTAAAPTDPVSAAAWEALMGPDGEYASAASYAAVIEKFGAVEPYVTIKQAEERHIAALTRQLGSLGVTVPANPYLGTIPAPADLKTAAANWATGERANVAMYDRLTASVPVDPRLTRVFGNLRRASLDVHLPMFTAAAAADGTLTADQMRTMHDEHGSMGGMHGSA